MTTRHVGHKLLSMAVIAALSGLCLNAQPANAASTAPLLTIDQMQYQGAFRIPNGTFGTSMAAYSYGAIGFNPDRNSLFVAGAEASGAVAEFAIPKLVNSTSLTDLSIASSPLQPFADVLHKASIDWGEGIRIVGMFYSGKKLMTNVYRFYDHAAPFLSTPTMILDNAADIKGSTTKGYLTVSQGAHAAGWISPVPKEWQATLGGTLISGMSSSTARAILESTSVGPSAYVYNGLSSMTNSLSISSIPMTELMNFPLDSGLVPQSDLDNSSRTNKLWTFISEASYGLIVPGTRTYLVLGGSGGHNSGVSYGEPPYGGYKGYYANSQSDVYPYYWLFDVNDLEKVKNGQLKSNQVRPYAVGVFKAPFQTDTVNPIAGGAFDEATGTLYLSVYRADTSQGTGSPPVIVAYKFNVAAGSVPKAPSNVTVQ